MMMMMMMKIIQVSGNDTVNKGTKSVPNNYHCSNGIGMFDVMASSKW